MTLAVQTFLRGIGSLEDLQAKYAIVSVRHPTYPNLVLLKYEQLESPFGEQIVQECRGIILDEADDWKLVCYRFKKFFNYGEGHAANIDWDTAQVQEKVDGSLMTTYFYDGKWHVATSGAPHAGGQVSDFPFTFAELFWKTYSDMGFTTHDMTESLCYSFELTSQYNRVVVRHTEPSLTLIGIHDPNTFKEVKTVRCVKLFPRVKTYNLSSFDEIVESFASIDPLSHEGYIVVDASFNRVKMKNPAYVAIHHLKDGFGVKRITEIVRTAETSEFLTYFPEYGDLFADVQGRYEKLVKALEELYTRIKDIEPQKDFALAVQADKSCKLPGAMFNLRAGKVSSLKQYLREMNLDHLMKVLELK